MSSPLRLLLPAVVLALGACASTADPGPGIPPEAVENTRTESNGDVITEYRVAGQLRVVKIEPSRGPAYYLYDHDGDGRIDNAGDNPPQTYFKLFGW